METEDLLDHVRSQLKKRRGSWQAISEVSGVPYFTLSKIASGATKNPRWKTLEKLLHHLEGTAA